MHEEWSNYSWIGVMVYIFIFARMDACGGHEDRGLLCARAPLFRTTRPLGGTDGVSTSRIRCLAE
jgi:hypothetical protein